MSNCSSNDLTLINQASDPIATCMSNAAGTAFPTGAMATTCFEASSISASCSQCMGTMVSDLGTCITACDAWGTSLNVPTTLSPACQTCVENLSTKYAVSDTICGINMDGIEAWKNVEKEIAAALQSNSAGTSLRSVMTAVVVAAMLLINV